MCNLEIYNKDRAIPYCSSIYNVNKISGKSHRGISEKGYEKCLQHCVVFTGIDCVIEMLDHVLSFKGETKKVNNKLDEFSHYLIEHNGSGFDSYVV